MTRFTRSPFEKLMTEKPEDRAQKPCPPCLSPDHPCYGCGNYNGQPCVGLCQKELSAWLAHRERNK